MSKARELAELGAVYDSGALSNRNLIINGAMQVAQRGTSVSNATGGYTTVDRFFQTGTLGGTFSWAQSSTAPDGFSSSFKVSVPTGFSSLTSSASARIGYAFEGQDLQQLKKGTSNAEKVTLSFYVRAKVTGTYVVELYDTDNTRHICTTYTINTADTWEKKTITFDGDTSGSLDNDNASSLVVHWWLAAGSNFTSGTLPTTWSSVTTANRAVGQVNSMASNNDEWYLTGVQLELGTEATPFEHRSFADELLKCKRYYESSNRDITGNANTDRIAYLNYTCYTTSSAYCTYFFEVEKRAIPTITHGSSNWRIYQNNALISTGGAGGTDGIGHRNFSLTISGPTFDVSEGGMCDYRQFDGIKIDAEL